MKLLFCCISLLFTFFLSAQTSFSDDFYKINITTESFIPEKNAEYFRPPTNYAQIYEGRYFQLIQFYNLPNAKERANWEILGLDLVDYLPKHTYFAVIDEGFDFAFIQNKIRSIINIDGKIKLEAELYHNGIPAHAIDESGMLNLVVSYYDKLNEKSVLKKFQNFGKIKAHRAYSRQIDLQILPHLYTQIIGLPFVQFVGAALPPAIEEANYWTGTGRSNYLSSGHNGLNFNGSGVTVAVGEGGYVGLDNIDFKGRLIETVSAGAGSSGHKNGVIARTGGAGNTNPTNRGAAWGSTVISSTGGTNYSGLYTSDDLRFTNHSFGWGVWGGYNSTARNHDLFVENYPLGAVAYSAGNNGGSTGYSPYSFAGWGNITGAPKQNKNNWACASTNWADSPSGFSSVGPTYDGRLMPQISIEGSGGTSHAAPKLVGNLGVLSEVYSNYHGSEPPSSLLKAVLLNTADDVGNAGIDFKTGYGRVNMRRAHNVIQSNQIITASIDNGAMNTHNITIPANTHQVRVLVYWRDAAAASNAATALINDLDLTVEDPSMTTHLPWILDHTANAANLAALPTQGADHLNNTEQVTIDNPAAGTYTVEINGFSVPSGPQEYFLIYEFLSDELQITYPINGDKLVPGSNEKIYWDSYGSSTSSFTLQYQLNGGGWQSIGTAGANERAYSWDPPSVSGGINSLKVRVMRDALISESNFGSLGEQPSFLSVEWACADAVKLNWGAVDGATSYKIYYLGANYMEEITSNITFDGTSAIVSGMSATEDVYFAVSAVTNGNESRRTNPVTKPAGDINCENVFTHAPQSVTKTGLTLGGAINPHNASVSNVKFEYGPTTSYGNQTSIITVSASGHTEEKVTFPITYALAEGQVMHYRLVATVGGATIQGNDMIAQLAPGTTAFGNGGGYVSINKNVDLNFGSTTDFSVSFWAKTTSTSNDATFISDKDWDSGSNAGWGVFFTGGTWKVNISDGNTREDINNIGTVNDGNWHHFAVTFDRGGAMAVYQDGEFKGSTSIAGIFGNIDTSFPINIFCDGELDYFLNGSMDEVAIWDKILSDIEIKDQFHHPLNGNETNLIAYWRFDEENDGFDVVQNAFADFNGASIIAGSVPLGIGDTELVGETSGVTNVPNVDIEFDFNSAGSANLVVSKIDRSPNSNSGLSGASEALDDQYWVIHRQGSGSFNVDITFTTNENLDAADEANPSQILLYQRDAGGDGDWVTVGTASSVNAANDEATFDGITVLNKQFLVVRDPSPVISVTENILNFNNVKVGCTSPEQTYNLSAFNLSNNLTISGGTGIEISETSGSGFTSSLNFSPSGGSAVKTIYVRLNPSFTGNLSGMLTHNSAGATTRTIDIPTIEVVEAMNVAGKAMDFNENGDYLVIEDLNWNSPSTYTVEWWLKPNTYNNWNQQIGNGWGGFLFHANSDGSVSVGVHNNSSRINSSPVLILNEWQHFAYVFDNGTSRLYRNGIELGSKTGTPNVNWSTFRIGHTGSHSINGELDEFRMWSTARTAQQIRENMHLSQTGNEAGLKAYIQFQTAANNVVDLSQNCYTVSVNGSPSRTTSDLAVAGGIAVSKDVFSTGLVSFDNGGTDTNVDIDFGTNPNGAITISQLTAEAPHGSAPSTSFTLNSDYYIIQNHGTLNTGLATDMTFSMPNGYVVNTTTSDYQLFKRGSVSIGNWGSALNPNTADLQNNQLIFNNVDGFSQFMFAKNPSAVLPIELTNFEARLVEKEVVLIWNTALEINNFGFEIQRYTGHDDWEIIGWVDGKGDTEIGHHYQFLDKNVRAGNQYYYRLNQIDLDGTSTFSPVRSVKIDEENGSINLYPNPVENTLFLEVPNFENDDFSIQIFNTIGQQIIEISKLDNQIIDVSYLPKGNYFLKFFDGENVFVEEFVKM